MPKITFNKHDTVSIALYGIHILLNFLGTPLLKYFYVLCIGYFIFLAFTKSWREIFIPTLVFFYLEGQGRVIWEYRSFFRIIFDIYIVIILLRHTVKRFSLNLPSRLNLFFKLMIIGHFGWYFVQLFNVASVGPLGPIFATKIYIFPILMFLMFLEQPLSSEQNDIKARNFYVYLIYILQLVLIFFQFSKGESSLLNLSQYYLRPMRGDVFAGDFFRPFGTAFVPGAMSLYFAFTLGFFFLDIKPGFTKKLFKILIYISTMAACFIMQVRVGLVLCAIVLGLSTLVFAFKSRFRIFNVFVIVSILVAFPSALNNIEVVQDWFPDTNLKPAIIRLKNIATIEGLASQRASFSTFLEAMSDRVSKAPLGLGPGRTGAANSQFINIIKDDPRFDMSFSWTLDNLFISLVIDLGIGMIFYTLLIVGLPIQTLFRYFSRLRSQSPPPTAAIVALICVFANLITSWGAISIPYNPSSFFFWFWLAYAMNQLDENPIPPHSI